MKLFAFVLLLICALVAVEGVPVERKKPAKCDYACAAFYDPVCAHDPSDTKSSPRLFSNSCILSLHNCEHNSNLVVVNDSKCQKAGGIRLS